MAVSVDDKGNLIIKTSIKSSSCDEMILRMEALIGLIQMKNEDVDQHSEQYYALELLRDLMPTKEQMTAYLANKATDSFN